MHLDVYYCNIKLIKNGGRSHKPGVKQDGPTVSPTRNLIN
jgi:hypothetical protein